MKDLRLLLLLSSLVLPLGCASVTLVVGGPGALQANERLDFFGVDFSSCRFRDDYYFRVVDDLIQEKLPQWNTTVSAAFVDAATRSVPLTVNLQKSTELNATLRQEALGRGAKDTDLVVVPPTENNTGGDAASLAKRIAPYVDQVPGKGAVLLVDQVTKTEGVRAYLVVFDRTSGKVVFASSADGMGDGYGYFGVQQFYLKPLCDIARRTAGSLRSAVVVDSPNVGVKPATHAS